MSLVREWEYEIVIYPFPQTSWSKKWCYCAKERYLEKNDLWNDLFQASRNPVRKIKVYKMKISIQSSATIDSQ